MKPKTKLVILVIIITLFMSEFIYIKDLNKIHLEKSISINIPSGSSTKQIAQILHDNNLIKNEFYFVTYIKQQDVATKLRPGSYTFGAGLITFDTILEELLKGGDDGNSVFITVPEGLTVLQIAELFEEKGFGTKDEFLETAKNIELPYEYIDTPGDYKRLEGFLFPETYSIPKSYNSEKIILLMVDEFDRVFNKEYKKRAEELEFSIKEIVTIASLIEREARVDSERPLISSVIHNRLEINMPLQIDATIQYILGKQKERLYYKDLEIKSPYNTYLNQGLPPTPIAVPGEACIKAALYPEETEYFYYRTKNDGSGEHNFSKTFNEHIKNGNK